MPLRAPRRTAALIAAPALISAGVFAAAPVAGAADAPAPAYRGSASALAVKVDLGGTTILDTVLPGGVKFPVGGTGELVRLPNELSNVATLQVLDESSKITKDNTLQSNALAASLSVLQGLVGAQLLHADCSADGSQVAGDSQVRGLTLAGTKIPVELGKPNFAAPIPAELAKLVQGGIYVNEQTHSDDGVLQIRALHLRLSVAPDALGSALRSTVPQVRALAERVAGAVETVTGKTLEQLLGKQQAITGGRHGALADEDVRHQASAPKAPAAQPAHAAGAAAAARPAGPATRSDTAAAAAGSSAAAPAQRSTAANTATTERKADDASVARQAQDTDSAATADEQAFDQRAERGAKSADPAPQPATPHDRAGSVVPQQQVADPEPAAEQPAGSAPAADSQPMVTERSRGATYGTSPAAPAAPADSADASAGNAAAQSRRTARAGTRADEKSDGSELSVRQRAAAPAAAVPGATAGKGLLDLDVVVSQVNCAGARIVEAAAPVKPAVLPHTGANGHATRDLGVAGLGLILAGSTVVGRLRRKRGPVAH